MQNVIDLDAVVERICQAARDFGFLSDGELHNDEHMKELRHNLQQRVRAILEEVLDAD